MKKIFTLCTFLLAFSCIGQTATQHKKKKINTSSYLGNTSPEDVGCLSFKQDTLYLLNDNVGLEIKKLWDTKIKEPIPVIVLVKRDILDRKIKSVILARKVKP